MEYTTRYVIALPLKETSSNTVMRKFIKHIVNREGIPSEILTDRGSNFLSHSMDELCQQLGIKQLRTIAHHPQTDGAVERFNRTLGDMLTAHVANEPDTPAQDKRILLLKRFRRSRTNNTADNLHLSSPLPRTWQVYSSSRKRPKTKHTKMWNRSDKNHGKGNNVWLSTIFQDYHNRHVSGMANMLI